MSKIITVHTNLAGVAVQRYPCCIYTKPIKAESTERHVYSQFSTAAIRSHDLHFDAWSKIRIQFATWQCYSSLAQPNISSEWLEIALFTSNAGSSFVDWNVMLKTCVEATRWAAHSFLGRY